ncbi:type IV pilin [Halobaculum sp. MBLA0143]|uniref:DUF7289 family protein n=1 Tax=Halobaculum sp. MBLA0143 TaxID=3079933 RepID=UPI003525BE36
MTRRRRPDGRTTRHCPPGRRQPRHGRGQSHVVGVALLVAVTVVSLGGLTAAVATTVDAGTAEVRERRVAGAVVDAIQPRRVTGSHTATVELAAGRLETVPRTVRLLNDTGTVRRLRTDAFVYRNGDTRVAAVAGGVVRGPPGVATVVRPPRLRRAAGSLVVGVAALGAPADSAGVSLAVGGVPDAPRTRLRLRTNVSHEATRHPTGDWRVAVETATPAAVADALARVGSVSRRDFDDDGVPSVVVHVADRRVVFVVHRLGLEVERV